MCDFVICVCVSIVCINILELEYYDDCCCYIVAHRIVLHHTYVCVCTNMILTYQQPECRCVYIFFSCFCFGARFIKWNEDIRVGNKAGEHMVCENYTHNHYYYSCFYHIINICMICIKDKRKEEGWEEKQKKYILSVSVFYALFFF